MQHTFPITTKFLLACPNSPVKNVTNCTRVDLAIHYSSIGDVEKTDACLSQCSYNELALGISYYFLIDWFIARYQSGESSIQEFFSVVNLKDVVIESVCRYIAAIITPDNEWEIYTHCQCKNEVLVRYGTEALFVKSGVFDQWDTIYPIIQCTIELKLENRLFEIMQWIGKYRQDCIWYQVVGEFGKKFAQEKVEKELTV